MLTPEEGETWAHKFYLIGDAFVLEEFDVLRDHLRLLQTILNRAECPMDILNILQKYDNDTRVFDWWSELMELPVQGEVNGQIVKLIDLLNIREFYLEFRQAILGPAVICASVFFISESAVAKCVRLMGPVQHLGTAFACCGR